jgi:cation:H+ antiporter
MALTVVVILAGLGLLAVAPDRFVLGSAGLADRYGVSRVLIGAVIIGFGTSAPEMLVSGLAAAGGEPEVGVGNIIGSNMANLGLVIGVAGLVAALRVPGELLRREVPLVIAATVAFAIAVQDGLTRIEGLVLLAGLAVALVIIVRGASRPAKGAVDAEFGVEIDEFLAPEVRAGLTRLGLDAGLGLLGTLLGAQLLVTGAIDVADELNLSGGFVGITIAAIGTSLPELVTAVAAARKGEDQLIIGNVLGSNLFNSLAVGGIVGLVGPGVITDATLTVTGVVLMLVMTALGTWALASRPAVQRWQAAGLLVVYLAMLPLLA